MKKQKPSFTHEEKHWEKGYEVIGLDEVGRGPLAGPVFVAAVMFKRNMTKEEKNTILDLGINDSKKLTPLKRRSLASVLKKGLCTYAIKASPVSLINKRGIVFATHEAMYYAIHELCSKIKIPRYHLLLDAFALKDIKRTRAAGQTALIGGDGISVSIAAASIIAKVARDAYMEKLAQKFPAYAWEKNKGYGTKVHRDAIQKHGVTEHHRVLFVRGVKK